MTYRVVLAFTSYCSIESWAQLTSMHHPCYTIPNNPALTFRRSNLDDFASKIEAQASTDSVELIPSHPIRRV